MTKVDCEDCFEKFTSKKLYINHVKSKSCPRTKAKNRQRAIGQSHQENGAKRVRLEGDPLALVPQVVGGTGTFGPPVQGELQGASHFASPSRVAELQGQIKNLSEEQKRALQEQITRKQRQVLQAIPYNQLSSKQKEILAKLSKETITPAISSFSPSTNSATRYVTLKAGQVLSADVAPPVKPSIQIVRKVVSPLPQVIQITADDKFSEENIAAEVEVKSPSPVRTGPIKVKAFAKAFLKFANVIKEVEASATSGPRATVKESCPVCKKIFSKSGLEGHIEAKHWISCSKCDKRFPVDQLEAHMKKDHELPRVPCASCGKVVFSQVLSQHMDIFHTKECEICNQKIADADFKTHLKDCQEGETWVFGEGDVEHNKEDRMVVTSGECVPLSEAEKNYSPILCNEEACDEVFATEQEMKQHKDKNHSGANKFLSFGGGMFMMMMVVDDAKDEGAEKETDPLDDSEVKESCQDFKSYVVKGIIDDVVEQSFSSLVDLKQKLCQELLVEALETAVMRHFSP